MDSETSIVLVIFAGTLIMAVMIIAIILFIVVNNKKIVQRENDYNMALKEKELEMIKAVFRTEENERELLSKNLHDEVGPLLSAMKLRFQSYYRQKSNSTFDLESCKQEENHVDDIMENVRTVSHNLSPHFLMKFGLENAIKNFACNVGNDRITVGSENFNEDLLSSSLKANIYRIVLELINNTIKHDPFEQMHVSFSGHPDKTAIKIVHDGKGFTRNDLNHFIENSTGLGLVSVMSRVSLINGEIDFKKSDKNTQASVTLKAPIDNEK